VNLTVAEKVMKVGTTPKSDRSSMLNTPHLRARVEIEKDTTEQKRK
jgi:hypothetical protein